MLTCTNRLLERTHELNDKARKPRARKLHTHTHTHTRTYKQYSISHLKWIKLILEHGFRYLHYIFSLLPLRVSFIRFLLCSIFQYRIQISIEYSKVFSKYLFFCTNALTLRVFSRAIDKITTRRKYKVKKKFPAFLFCRLLVNLKRIC